MIYDRENAKEGEKNRKENPKKKIYFSVRNAIFEIHLYLFPNTILGVYANLTVRRNSIPFTRNKVRNLLKDLRNL